MKLYGASISPYVRKVAAVLNLKGLEHEAEDTLPHTLPRALSPTGKIPAFSDGDVAIADSSVICDYLEEAYPAIPALPKAIAARARSRHLEEYADSKLGDLCIGVLFVERFVKPALRGEPTDAARVAQAIDELLPPELDYLEAELPGEGFLFGDFGIADISIVSPFINAAYVGYAPDAARWPKLAAYIARVSAHPAVAAHLAREAALKAQMGLG